MRAILIATGWEEDMKALLAYRPSPLLNVVGKPVAHHVMEYLNNSGIRHCDILLHHLPTSIRNSLEDGKRWGVELQYHLCKDGNIPFKTLIPVIQGWSEEIILLGTLDTLPDFPINDQGQAIKTPTLIMTPSKKWTKWGIFSLSHLKNLPWNLHYNDIPAYFQNKCKYLTGKALLSVDSYQAFKNSNIKLLQDTPSSIHMPTTSVPKSQGVWQSKGTSVHPTAKIIPPVFLGENTYVEEKAEIGPNVVIESNCIIDRKCKISNSLICRSSYIGEALTISNSVVDRNLLINTDLNSEVSIIEDFILSEVKSKPIRQHIYELLEKCLATTFLIVLLPLICVVWPFSKIKRKPVLSIPSSHRSAEPKTFELLSWENKSGESYPFLHSFISEIPKLINIAKGDLHFVGLPPRNLKEANQLPRSWRNLYLKSNAGIINLSALEPSSDIDPDQVFACEVYQTINTNILFSLKLAARWLLYRA